MKPILCVMIRTGTRRVNLDGSMGLREQYISFLFRTQGKKRRELSGKGNMLNWICGFALFMALRWWDFEPEELAEFLPVLCNENLEEVEIIRGKLDNP